MAKIEENQTFGADLLLLSMDKRLKFNATLKGNATFQNFACFTLFRQVLQKSNQDEVRLRNALTPMYNE